MRRVNKRQEPPLQPGSNPWSMELEQNFAQGTPLILKYTTVYCTSTNEIQYSMRYLQLTIHNTVYEASKGKGSHHHFFLILQL